jgi:hypothetical protein
MDKSTCQLPFTPWNEHRSQLNMMLCGPQNLSAGYFGGVKSRSLRPKIEPRIAHPTTCSLHQSRRPPPFEVSVYSYNKTNQMHQFLKLFIFARQSTCFGRSFRPSSGVQNCTYSNRYMSNRYGYLLASGNEVERRKDRPKHVEYYAKINN